MTATRPDISYVVTKLSQNMSNPTVQDLGVAKGVLRYLQGTLEYALVFRKSNECVKLRGFCNSDWASSLFVVCCCLCILHQSCLTITAGTANCPILGGFGSSLHLLWRELGSLTCLRVTLPRTRNLHL